MKSSWSNFPFQDDLPSNAWLQASSFCPVSGIDRCLVSRDRRGLYIVSFSILHDTRESAAWQPRHWAVWVNWFNIVQLFLPEKSLVYFHKLRDVIRDERQRNVRTEQTRSPRWKHWVPWTRRSNIFFDLEGKTLLCLWPVGLRKFAPFIFFIRIYLFKIKCNSSSLI